MTITSMDGTFPVLDKNLHFRRNRSEKRERDKKCSHGSISPQINHFRLKNIFYGLQRSRDATELASKLLKFKT